MSNGGTEAAGDIIKIGSEQPVVATNKITTLLVFDMSMENIDAPSVAASDGGGGGAGVDTSLTHVETGARTKKTTKMVHLMCGVKQKMISI